MESVVDLKLTIWYDIHAKKILNRILINNSSIKI